MSWDRMGDVAVLGRFVADAPGADEPRQGASLDVSAPQAVRRLWVAKIEDESETVRSFWLEPVDGRPLAANLPGQFLPIALDIPGRDVVRRTYTISSAFDGRTYRLSVKREALPGRPAGVASNWMHDTLRVGSVIQANAPRGDFVIDDSAKRPIALISGGIGVTPMIAMLEHLVARDDPREIVFLQAVRHSDDHAFRQHVRSVTAGRSHVRVHVRYSEPRAADLESGKADSLGVIDEPLLRAVLPSPDIDVYLCGPPGFMQAIYDALLRVGVPDRQIQFEAFGPASLQRQAAPVALRRTEATAAASERPTVRFAKSGIAAAWDPATENLLAFAEAQGLQPDFGCRSGTCGTCAVRATAGHHRYVDEPLADTLDGEVLICCAVPDGPIELDL